MEQLSVEEQRVLGSLLEKQATVPDSYPMTLKGLRAACNQASSRDPVLDLDEVAVQRALDSLKARRLVRFVHPGAGERTTRFRQVLDEALDLGDGERAVLCLLLLRGPQTPGELRTRSERLHDLGSSDAAEEVLAALAGRDDPLVVELPRRPGDRQARWAHRFGPVPAGGVEAPGPVAVAPPAAAPAEERVRALEAQVAELAARVTRLERDLGLAP